MPKLMDRARRSFKTLGLAVLAVAALALPGAVSAQDAPSATTATYGDWVVRCRNVAVEGEGATLTELCEMANVINVVRQGQAPQPLAQIAIGGVEDADGASTMKLVLQLPIGVNLRPGAALVGNPEIETVEEGRIVFDAGYFRCTQNACLADADLTDEDIANLGSADAAQLQFVDGSGRPVAVAVSLTGFSSAAAAIQPGE